MAKVAILSFYTGVAQRGVETFAHEIAKRLLKKHKITVFQAGPIKHYPQIRVYQIKASACIPRSSQSFLAKAYLDFQSLKIFIFTVKAIPKIVAGKYDLIIPLNGGWQTAIVRIITKITNSKMLISGHAGIGSDDAANLFFRPDVFVALTSAQLSWAKRLAPEVRTEFIPNGVDLALFHPKIKPKKLSLKKPIVVCVSALDPYKRINLTIKAVAKTRNLSLLILGDGQLRGYLDSLGKRLLGARYLRLNPAYHQMPAYYRAGSVFTLASKTEAFGISYVEAMACNLSVVTTNDASRAEIIQDAGILTNPENIEQYAHDLLIATKSNYRNVPYNQALKFSWNKIAQKYSDLAAEITQKHR